MQFKKSKFFYYALNIFRQFIPAVYYQTSLKKKLGHITKYNPDEILDRVNYYNKLDHFTQPGSEAIDLNSLQVFKRFKTYKFDIFEFTRYFKKNLKASFLFGDVNHVSNTPTIQKSRPLIDDNRNAILMKLDKFRHFIFIKDKIAFTAKKDILIGRAVVTQPHRIKFMEIYFGHPMCNLGQVNKTGGNIKWLKPKLPISAHLKYKFILSLEGNDVATNLKWVMSSNSIAVMPKPKYETWFMEGRLIPDFHYILIKDDYSDLEEKLNFYITHTGKAEEIVHNANRYVGQFIDKDKEDLISLLVLQKYFKYTSQHDND